MGEFIVRFLVGLLGEAYISFSEKQIFEKILVLLAGICMTIFLFSMVFFLLYVSFNP
jgi:hypothetical protein